MNIVVTGCAGFIGSHLCEALVSDGHIVTGVDCFTDYYSPVVKHANLTNLLNRSSFTLLETDVANLTAEMIGEADIIYHLSAQPGIRQSWADFQVYLDRNLSATWRLLEMAKASKTLRRFVFASSSSVYGNIREQSVNEDHPLNPFSPYGVTKVAAEKLCHAYQENFGLSVTSLRFFTVFGSRQRPDMAFARLIVAALEGMPFTLYGDGLQERDFTFVGDIVHGLCAAGKSASHGIFNVGGLEPVSMRRVIAVVEQVCGKNVHLNHVNALPGDVRRTSADISRISRDLGYVPKTTLEQGIAEQVAYFSDHPEIRSIVLSSMSS